MNQSKGFDEPTQQLGYNAGETCNRNGCNGVITEHETDLTCSCHVSPPCSYCTDSRDYCPKCGWDGREDQIEQQSKVKVEPLFNFKSKTFHDLDKTKIDWIYEHHTHFSMIKKGVYPIGTTEKEVYEEVKGTFGGRFEQFGNGTFKFIAYTD